MSAVQSCLTCANVNSNSSTTDSWPDLEAFYVWCQQNAPGVESTSSVAPTSSRTTSSTTPVSSTTPRSTTTTTPRSSTTPFYTTKPPSTTATTTPLATTSSYNATFASLASSASSLLFWATWCEDYFDKHASLAANCTLLDGELAKDNQYQQQLTVIAPNTSSTVSINSTAATAGLPTASTQAASSSHRSHRAAIAGGVVGGVIGLALVVVLAWFVWRKRRTRPVQREEQAGHEKAQLHSDELKPDRKELSGTAASQSMLEKKPTDISELPANERVVDKHRSQEMASNEPAAHEMETTENEMAALDRMARMTDSTTLSSGNTRSQEPPSS